MKKIIFICVVLLMFAGVVNAASINGDYKGNPIVKITSGGNEVVAPDVPGMILNGRTVVPINLLTKLGATVTWDASTYSVDVELPKSNLEDSAYLIEYAKLANMYKLTEDMSRQLFSMASVLSSYFTGHNQNLTNAFTDENVNDDLNYVIDSYNSTSDEFNTVSVELPDLDTTDLANQLHSDYNAIDELKLATTDLLNWNRYRNGNDIADSNDSFNKYLTEASSGAAILNQSISNCQIGYNTYILKVIN